MNSQSLEQSIVLKHLIYQYATISMFLCILLLVILLIRKSNKISLLNDEIHKLHRVASYLPEEPNSGYIHYDLVKKQIFYSAAMRKIMKLAPEENPNSLDPLATFLKPESMNLIESFFNNLVIDLDFSINLENSIIETNNDKKFWVTYQPIISPNHNGFILWFFIADQLVTTLNDYKEHAASYSRELESMLGLINNINIPIWFRDQNYKIRYYNQAYKKLADSKEPSDFSFILSQDARENALEMSDTMTFNINGERKIYNIHELSPINNTLSIGYAIDYTKIEQLKNEIKQHTRALSDFISSSSSGMALFASDMKLQMWNFSFVKLWDLDEKYLATRPTYPEIIDVLRQKRKLPEHINFADFKKNRINLFKSLTTIHNEFLYLSEGRTIRIIITPHALGGLLFIYEDMTDKLILERSYNTLIAVQEATLNTMHEAVCVIGPNGKLKLYNVVFANLWKMSSEYLDSHPHFNDIIKKMEDQFLYPDDFDHFKSAFLSSYERRHTVSQKFEMKNNNIIERSISSLPDGSILIIDLDITDSALVERSLRERNEALLATDKIKTTFLSNISYQLRSPLTSILGFSEMLCNGILGDLTEQQKEYLSYIKSSSEDLKLLIDDIIELAVLDSGQVELQKNDVELYKVISSAMVSIKNKELLSNINYHIYNKNKIKFYADEFRIKQALYNIGSLIASLSPPGSQIQILLDQIQDYISIEFKTNITMPSNNFIMLFDRFNPLYDSISVGKEFIKNINLNITKKIIELHNGEISASNDNNGMQCIVRFFNS